jgi:SAM-dependent methyltransferase
LTQQSEILAQHYAGADIVEAVTKALAEAGKAEGPLEAGDLSSIDQFHVRGLLATKELAAAANPSGDMSILDIGSGLGGAARYLASTFGCRVTGLDLMPSYCAVAAMLTERSGLAGCIRFHQGNALELPFADRSFDQVWTQHVAMNIADKTRLYAEMRRVLRPQGRLAIYDPVASGSESLRYPLPWARDDRTSFVPTEPAMKKLLLDAGFSELSWEDKTAAALQWFDEMQKKWAGAKPSPLGIHVLIGPDIRAMSGNLRTNLQEGRAKLIQAVYEAH